MTKPDSIKQLMLKKFFNLVVSLFAAGTASADTIPLKVLFIGNSYTHMHNMPKMFGKIAKDAGMDVIVEKSAKSGASFHEHSERADMFEVIKKRKWDYVILQGYSRELSFSPEYIDTATVPFVSKITDAIYENNACTNVLFYMTWGYEDGFNEREEVNSYLKMADSIERGYSYLGKIYDLPVVPVGMVWKEIKNNTSIDLYADDRAHPSKSGSYLIANTFFESIFGVQPNENLSIVEEHEALVIKTAVSDVLDGKKSLYNLDRNAIAIDTQIVENATNGTQYRVDYEAKFQKVTSIKWLFDDGATSTEFSGHHIFKDDGLHHATIHVTDECGTTKIYDYRIMFTAVDNRRRRRREEREARKKARQDKRNN